MIDRMIPPSSRGIRVRKLERNSLNVLAYFAPMYPGNGTI